MGSQLQQVLRSLCLNTGWKYAVFWKLKQQTRMMFTWEDAYYDGNRYPEGPYSHDPLGLTVAKMSYQVYSLGEGVVGKVAVSGKHSWTFSDEEHVVDSSSSSEYYGGWQAQFQAGIKTIAVVAVIPHGVVQLGSLHIIPEDLKLVDLIRNFFSELQDLFAGRIPSSIKNNADNSCLSNTCTEATDSAVHDSIAKLKGPLHENEANLRSRLFSHPGESTRGFSTKTLKMNTHERAECSVSGKEISLLSSPTDNVRTRQPQQEESEPLNTAKCGETNDIRDLGKQHVKNAGIDNSNIHSSEMVTTGLPSENPDISPFSFGAGYELYEALGPSFQRQNNNSAWDSGKTGPNMPVDISEGIGSCNLLMGNNNNSDMHLLEAVVAKVGGRSKGYGSESEKSCHETCESLLTAEKTTFNSIGTISSFDRDTSSSLNSVTCGVGSLNGFQSASSSRGSEHLERAQGGIKMNKKRARPGEGSRPRPRDRQLIQDRIKELRELVPNGSKCSIDSLLERTIKHMMFLQSVTKHAEKLQKCSASKLLEKDTGIRRFSCREQGSSWAVEVGNNQKMCPIIVENINMNGQMLVEMLSKESHQFLEIAETIRRLGLTILKGVSEAFGNQTWMCFVVEGQNNRSMHRMDVLWPLMQLLQPKLSN